jgi:hypothetical protein
MGRVRVGGWGSGEKKAGKITLGNLKKKGH